MAYKITRITRLKQINNYLIGIITKAQISLIKLLILRIKDSIQQNSLKIKFKMSEARFLIGSLKSNRNILAQSNNITL